MHNSAGVITSLSSPRVLAAKRLHAAKGRRESRCFLAEGPQAVREALTRPDVVQKVFVAEDASAVCRELMAASPVPCTVVSSGVLGAMAETKTPQGILAVCRWLDEPLQQLLVSGGGPLVILDQVSDPGNIGTIIRTACAAGARGVVLLGGSADPFNGKCVRSTAGAIFRVPLAIEVDTASMFAGVREANLELVVTVMNADQGLFAFTERTERRPAAWIFGSEAHGVSAELIHRADQAVSIPLLGPVESLNVASAAAICLYADLAGRVRR